MEMTSARKPFYQRGSFWLGPFTWGRGLLLAVGLGIAWSVLGGFPRGHDAERRLDHDRRPAGGG
jgi:hypothetical protein